MPVLVTGIHASVMALKGMDARDERAHDSASYPFFTNGHFNSDSGWNA